MKKGILARSLLLCVVVALSAGQVRAGVETEFLIREADRQQATKAHSRAISTYQQLAVLHPLWAMPHLRLGQVYVAQGRWNEAANEFYLALELDMSEDEALLGLGLVAHQQGDIEGAISKWSLASDLNPRNIEAQYRLGRAYLDRLQPEMAQQKLERTLVLDSDHQGAHYHLGLLLAGDDATMAIGHLNAAAGGDDGQLSLRAREMVITLEETSLSEDEAYVVAILGHAYVRHGMPSLAVAQLREAVGLQPDNHSALAYLGYALFSTGQADEARQMLREVTYTAPKYALGHHFLAVLHRSEGYLPTALWEFKRSLWLDPSNAAAYADIADTYQRMGRYLEAAEWYQAAVEIAPDEASFRLLLAQFYVDVLLRAEEGQTAARDAATLAPDDAFAQDLLGWAHYLAGDLAEAQIALEKAVSLDPEFARAYYHQGVVFSQLGEQQEARSAYQRAVDLDTNGVYREKAMVEMSDE